MKKLFTTLIIVLGISQLTNAQITGQLIEEGGVGYPAAKTSIVGSKGAVNTDFDGKFELSIPKEETTFDLLIDLNDGYLKVHKKKTYKELKIIIKDIKVGTKNTIDLGKIELPTYKSLSIEEYAKLGEKEKLDCIEIAHYANVLGYQYARELESKTLILNCKNGKEISEFEFNPKEKIITVSWNSIKGCQ